MAKQRIIIFLCFSLFPLSQAVTKDPCTHAQLLPSLAQRNIGYKLKAGEARICDYYLSEEWYKLGQGYSISNSNKDCGTTYPWHTSDPLPASGIGNVTVCKNDKSGNDCAGPKTIQVKFCGKDNYVFYLPPTDACPEAYCIEKLGPGNGQAGPPTLSGNVQPAIDAEVLRPRPLRVNELFFYCDFNPEPGQTYFYTVSWYLSNGLTFSKHIWSSNPTQYNSKTGFRTSTALRESLLATKGIKNLGFKLACTVAASNDQASIPGPPKYSLAKLIGIEVVNKTSIDIRNKEQKMVHLRLTVPFGCPNNQKECGLKVQIFLPDSNSCQASDIALNYNTKHRSMRGCGVEILNTEVGQLMPLTLQGFMTGNVHRQGWHSMARLTTLKTVNSHPLFQGYFLDPIEINLLWEDKKDTISGKVCWAHNDPHMYTFDKVAYENQNLGTFILYQNKKYNIQVQIKTVSCGTTPFCNCGAAVAVGKDVFMVNNCDKSTGWDIRFKNCEDGVLKEKVLEKGRNYKIQLPTGGEVKIMTYSQHLNIDVIPSLYDYHETSGLCGPFDNNKANDRQARRGHPSSDPNLSWRVPDSESLFLKTDFNHLKSWDEEENLCKCPSKTSGVSGLNNVLKCESNKMKTCKTSDYKQTNMNCSLVIRNKRHVRDVSYTQAMDTHSSMETTLTYTESNVYQGSQTKITKRALPYDAVSARSDCLNVLNTTVFQLCETVPDLDVGPYVDSCVQDALLTNSLEWASSHLQGVKSQCKYQVQINQPLPPEVLTDPSFKDTLNHTSTNDTSFTNTTTALPTTALPMVQQFSPDFLARIEELSCLNDCSGNGICVNGTCQCNSGFTDPDCSIDLSQPPIMRGIPDRGLCDLNQRLCGKTSVLGDNFAETSALSCHIEPFMVNTNSTILPLSSVRIPATRLSFAEVSCPLQDQSFRNKRSTKPFDNDNYLARGYSISISNDGVNFGIADSIVVFDSNCVNCTKLGTKVICMKKPGFCMKKGHCFADGQPSGCEVCKSSTVSEWLKGPDCPFQPAPESDGPKLWIIGAVLGAAVCFIGVAVIVFIIKRKGQMVVEHKANVPQPEVKPYGYHQ